MFLITQILIYRCWEQHITLTEAGDTAKSLVEAVFSRDDAVFICPESSFLLHPRRIRVNDERGAALNNLFEVALTKIIVPAIIRFDGVFR